jgi:hypothetical protein
VVSTSRKPAVSNIAPNTFSEYYEPFEADGTSMGEVLRQLLEVVRQAAREEVRQSLSDDGGPVTISVEFLIARATKPSG